MEEKSFKIDGETDSAFEDYALPSYVEESTEDVVITDDVVAVVAGQAAMQTDYVAALSSTVAGSIVESFGLKYPTKGVTVRTKDGKVVLDLGDSTREITAFSDVALDKGTPVIATELNAEVFTVKPL